MILLEMGGLFHMFFNVLSSRQYHCATKAPKEGNCFKNVAASKTRSGLYFGLFQSRRINDLLHTN